MAQTEDRLGGKKTLKVMGVLEDIEKDEVKKRVDIITLFASFGVALSPKGKGYVGVCPWHEEKDPSLSVDAQKGLYNCFGCGESGDVVTLVEKMKACGFREALAYLRKEGSVGKNSPSAAAGAGRTKEKSPPQRPQAAAPDKASPPPAEQKPETSEEQSGKEHEASSSAQAQQTEAAINQKQLALKVIEHYHQTLLSHEPALAYLKKRGLNVPHLIKHYRLGYADGKSLSARISNTQKELLKQTGFITPKGAEHFTGCLVFPIFKEDGSLGEGYGRSINGSEPAHRYLPGAHQGLFNYPALRVYEELYFTESIIDALSLIALGIENVGALYGANGFTDEHLSLLKAGKSKSVILALDNDEPGVAAAQKLQEKLLAAGLSVRIIFPPLKLTEDGSPIKDWNDYLISGGSKEAILKLLNETTETKGASKPAGLELKKTAQGYLVEVGEVAYRITGIKLEELGLSLRATLRITYHGESVFDTVELYSHRGRSALINQAVYRLGLKAEEVEKQLSGLITALEEAKAQAWEEKTRGATAEKKLTALEVELGMKFLKSPRLMEELVSDLTQIGLVAEPMTKLLLYLIATSRKRAEPLSAYIIGRSSGGKSWLVNRIMALLPEEEALKLSSASDVAFYYTGSELKGKVVVLGEFVGAENIEMELRELISEGKITRLVTTKDPDSGAMKYSRVTAYGPIAFISTTTNPDVNAENLSRCLVLYADESQAQTEKILKFQRQLKGPGGPYLKLAMSEIIKKHQLVQMLLEDVEVINPFCDYIEFPTLILKGRRVHVNFLLVIEMLAFLYQKQRELKTLELGGKQVRYIQCTIEDYRLAYQMMMSGILENTLDDMPKAAKDFYTILSALKEEKAQKEKMEQGNVLFSRREMVERSGWSPKQVRLYVEKLLEYECLEVVAGFSRGEQHKYRLLKRNELVAGLLKKIPTPEEVEKRMQQAGNNIYTDKTPGIF